MFKFIFLHKNNMTLSICKKTSDGYVLDGWFQYKEYDKVEQDSNNYFSFHCVSNCEIPICESKKITIYSTNKEHGNLKNYIDEKGEIIKASFPEEKNKDIRTELIKYDYYLLKSRFNDGKIYFGTDEEIMNYFIKKKNKFLGKLNSENDVKQIKTLQNKLNKVEKNILQIKDDQIKDLELKNSNLQKAVNDFKAEHSKSVSWDNQFKPKYDNRSAEDFYDIIVNINSIKGIKYGWKIKYNEIGKKRYDELKNKESLKIGIIGNGNKGKSFFLQKLSEVELPKGTSIKTEGLSLKYPKFKDSNNNIILLDSAGLETPLLKDENIKDKLESPKEGNSSTPNSEQEKKMDFPQMVNDLSTIAKDKALTELFLQNFIMIESDILIAMVGILTYSEQKLLNRIKADLKKRKKNYSLYVIHNLQTYVEKEQVEKYINETLLNCATFELKERKDIYIHEKEKKMNDTYYVEVFKEQDTSQKIFHLIFANDSSNAGNYYNEFTLEFLRKRFNDTTQITNFPLVEKIKESFQKMSTEMLENKIEELNFSNEEDCIKLMTDKDIILKRCFVNELGISFLQGNGYEPKYSYFCKDNKMFILVEVPGKSEKISIKCKLIQSYYYFTITGIKKVDEDKDIKDSTKRFNSREQGNFFLQFPVLVEDFMLASTKCEKFERKENGILQFEFRLQESDEIEGQTFD